MEKVNNSDCSSDYSGDITKWVLRRRTSGCVSPLKRRKSPRNPRRKAPVLSARTFLPSTQQEIKDHLDRIGTQIKGLSYTPETTLRVINAALILQLEYLTSERKKTTKKGALMKDRVCKMFRIGPNTYSKIISEYMSESQVIYQSSARGNFEEKAAILPRTKEVVNKIRVFVWARQASSTRESYCEASAQILLWRAMGNHQTRPRRIREDFLWFRLSGHSALAAETRLQEG